MDHLLHQPLMRTFSARILPLFVALFVFSGCSGRTVTVEIPPKVDLSAWPVIGIVDFTADTHEELSPEATQKFLAQLQSAQPGTRLLELGREENVLLAVNRNTLDPEAIKAIGRKYGVAAVLAGRLEVSEATPRINLSPDLKSFSAKASVKAALSAKLRETATGATVWTNGAHGQWKVAGMDLGSTGLANVSISDPAERYDQMLGELADVATRDFRPRYERHRVED